MTATTTAADGYVVLFIPLQDAPGALGDRLAGMFEKAIDSRQLVPITEWHHNPVITKALTAGGWNWVAPTTTAAAAHARARQIIGAAE